MSPIPATQRRLVLRQRPEGLLSWDDVELVDGPVPELDDGQALLRNELLAMDATVRSWLNDSDGYLPPVELGDVVRASSIGTIVASRCPAYDVGDVVYSLGGTQEYVAIEDDIFSTRFPPGTEMAPMLSIYGATGLTAYIGAVDIGHVREGETFVVSAAAGATGSLAGQIAKILGARVVGVVGSEEKRRFVTEELGFDAAINHRTDDLAAAMREHCPRRIDVYFDNVGGPILDAALNRLAFRGRVVLCGAISVYNESHKPPGPANYLNLIQQRGRMEGFIAFDHWDRLDEVLDQLRTWVDEGKLRHVEHTFEGLESTVDALNALFTGANTGKVVIRLD